MKRGMLRSIPTLLFLCAGLGACASLSGPASGGAKPVSKLPVQPSTALPATAPSVPASGASSPSGPAVPAATAASAAPSVSMTPPTGDAARLPAFDRVIDGARRLAGPLTLWQKEDRVWIEWRADRDAGPFFLSPKMASGLGEAGVYGGLMRQGAIGGAKLVEFRRVSSLLVQLLAPRTSFRAEAGTPAERAVQAAFADSLVGSFAVASQPKDGAVLLDATGFFLGDLAAVAPQLQQALRQSYALDVRNSSIVSVRVSEQQTSLRVRNHFVGGGNPAGGPGGGVVPRTLPDPRSFFAELIYTFTRLPAQAMRPRPADERLGHFISTVADFSDEFSSTPKRRWVQRWRLEPKDPGASLSEPLRPITFWIDRTVPLAYRPTITEAVLEWNRAFERIGLRNAIVVRQQGESDDFDTLDTEHASIRWMTNLGSSFGAIAPSHVDPRSGEILDADIALESLSLRSVRHLRADLLGPNTQSSETVAGDEAGICLQAEYAARDLAYGLEVRASQPDLPESLQTRDFVLAYLKQTVMHEVGHALGLRHNFRASAAQPLARLSDPAWTHSHALSGSVMDYDAINLAAPGQPAVAPFNVTLGPYDYWAIEYAYKPLAPEQEAAELARIAQRGTEPGLGYGTDEDAALGIDPEVQTGDLGDDPVAFARRRLAIAQDVLRRQETRPLGPDAASATLRRTVAFALRDVAGAAGVVAREIGGVRMLRDRPGSGRDALQPVSAERQRAALDFVSTVLRGEGLEPSAALQRRLAPDYLDRADAWPAGNTLPLDFSPGVWFAQQMMPVLGWLYGDAVAARVLDNRARLDAPREALSLRELYRGLDAALWEGPSTEARRELQRAQVHLLVSGLMRPPVQGRALARAEQRSQARALVARLEQDLARVTPDSAAQAHLSTSLAALKSALAAPWVRPSP